MSGGAFDYKQYAIAQIAEEIQHELENAGKEKPREELWKDKEWYEKYPEDKFYPNYTPEVKEQMKEAVKALRIAYTYAKRVDWLLSGDDGEESFLERLKEDLQAL